MAGSGAGNGTAPPQAGVLEGVNPIAYTASNPISLFIVQAGIIIVFCRVLHYPLALIGQPRVIAEVIGGILLGPSVMMRIPGFKEAIFPTESMPILSNVANLGLVLFLFLVALELDIRLFTANWRVALAVGLAGMILPFVLGCAVAWGLFNSFHDDGTTVDINFGVYALFIGTALAITAFPVLCRILSELKLLGNSVGVTVLAAGIGNDVTGWILLALCVALVNNGSGLSALYVLLCCVGWTLLLALAIRPAFLWMLKRTGSLQNGPTQGVVAITLLLTLTSAWFTGIIGVHPIFGAFLVGLICPHDGGFAIRLTEKIEDLVSVLFLPLYFALSGLSTNLGLLDDGKTWGYVVAVIAIAFAGKILGGALAARACKLLWRESFTIGVLMSCKGLVELIVLNIGLQARILSQRTFTIFVVMALVTTVSTTPLTKLLYPPSYRQKLERWKRGEIDWDGNLLTSGETQASSTDRLAQSTEIRRLFVQIRLDALPDIFAFLALLGGKKAPEQTGRKTESEQGDSTADAAVSLAPVVEKRPLQVYGLRLLELTERTSTVMQVAEEEEAQRDPILKVFTTFTRLQSCSTAARIAVVPAMTYADTITAQAAEVDSDLLLVPLGDRSVLSEEQSMTMGSGVDAIMSSGRAEFVENMFEKASCNIAVLVNQALEAQNRPKLTRTISAISTRSQGLRDVRLAPRAGNSCNILVPFFGGADDRVAARLALELSKNQTATTTIVHFQFQSATDESAEAGAGSSHEPPAVHVKEDPLTAEDLSLLRTIQSSLPANLSGRVTFTEVTVTGNSVWTDVMRTAKECLAQSSVRGDDFVLVGRRHVGLAESSVVRADLRRAVGMVAEKIISSGLECRILITQEGARK